jgi:hypothetical protein
MTKRPNHSNKTDACCRCSKLSPTPVDHEKPEKGQLSVWQPNSNDPPQWLCAECRTALLEDEKRGG